MTSAQTYRNGVQLGSPYPGDEYVAPSEKEVFVSIDWTQGGIPIPGAPGAAFSPLFPLLNDATVVDTAGVGLQVNPVPTPFTQTVDQTGMLNSPAVQLPYAPPAVAGFLDRIKYLVFSPPGNFPPAPTLGWPAPDDGRELVVTASMSGKTTFAATKFPAAFSPNIVNVNRDTRMGVAAICVFDPATFMFFDFLITNDTYYAGYGVRPFYKPAFGGPGPDVQAFEANVPIGRRARLDPLGDVETLSIAYNRQAGTVRWLINGDERYKVSDLGFPLDSQYMVSDYSGPPTISLPTVLKAGFGLYAPLDSSRPLDPGVDTGGHPTNLPLVAQIPASPYHFDPIRVVTGNGSTAGDPLQLTNADYVDSASLLANRLFGQGVQMLIKSFEVAIV